MSFIMNWVSCILGGNDLDCETPVALTRKGLRTDGTLENPNSYRFSKCAVTYGRPVFIEFGRVFVPDALTSKSQVLDSASLIARQQWD